MKSSFKTAEEAVANFTDSDGIIRKCLDWVAVEQPQVWAAKNSKGEYLHQIQIDGEGYNPRFGLFTDTSKENVEEQIDYIGRMQGKCDREDMEKFLLDFHPVRLV